MQNGFYSSQSVGGARAPGCRGAVGGLAAVLSSLIRLGGRRFPSDRLAPPPGALPFAPLPCTAPSGPRWSLAWVQCVLELGAGVADMKTFLVDCVVRVELDDNGVAGWVDLLWGLPGRRKQQSHRWLSASLLQLKLKTSVTLELRSNGRLDILSEHSSPGCNHDFYAMWWTNMNKCTIVNWNTWFSKCWQKTRNMGCIFGTNCLYKSPNKYLKFNKSTPSVDDFISEGLFNPTRLISVDGKIDWAQYSELLEENL